MVSLDLKDAYLQVPVHPDSHQLLHFLLASPHVPRSLPGSWLLFGDASRQGRPDTPVFGWLADPSLLQVRGSVGDGTYSVLVQSPQNSHQRGEVLSSANPDFNLLGNGNHEPSLGAFPSPEWVSTLLTWITEVLAYRWQNVMSWRCLLGCLSSLPPSPCG